MVSHSLTIWVVPRKVDFPLPDSVFEKVCLNICDICEETGEIRVVVDEEEISVRPGEEVRLGVRAGPGGGPVAYTCPKAWTPVVENALSEEKPVGVWVIRNLGWNDSREVSFGAAGS